MKLQITNNREIKPQKVSLKQGESNTTVLRFERDSYKYDQIDLRDYKAYAVTCLNGNIDITELAVTTDGAKLILNWTLSDYTLRHAGALAYQIVFKGTEDSAAVFNTYQAILQISSSIDGDNYVSANYPTLLKQWLDIIDARSGAIGSDIVYMNAGSSIAVEERAAGNLYYQWNETPTTAATSATGVVNLGSSPYADSGLYINGKHVFVDNTADNVQVLEPSVWVDAINAADCGVIASDISSDGDIIILLTASAAGTAGNQVTYDLGQALYGAGAGQINPSGGKTRGAHLTGGSEEQVGVDSPDGRFEDHFGNKLTRTHAEIEAYSMVPDYAKAIPDINAPFTAPSNGYILTRSGGDGTVSVTICGIEIESRPTATGRDFLLVPIAKGDVVTAIIGDIYRYFVPCKTNLN